MTIRLSTGAVNAIMTSGVDSLFDTDGAINVYSGAIPADADADVGAGTLLATLLLAANWINAPVAGVMTLATISPDVAADASGTAAWFRIYDVSEGVTGASTTKRRIDGTVGTSGADINFGTVAFVAGAQITITSCSITMLRT